VTFWGDAAKAGVASALKLGLSPLAKSAAAAPPERKTNFDSQWRFFKGDTEGAQSGSTTWENPDGLQSLDRAAPWIPADRKDAYYFYQSRWTSEPVLHIFPHWNWAGREGKNITVSCFTNCDTVELFLNGKSLGAAQIGIEIS
jgi:Domain of unknown function (DUF4982)